MLEQRNKFIANMNNSIANHKKQFHTLLSKLGWTLQSVTEAVKDENNDETNEDKQENENEDKTISDKLRKETHVKEDGSIDSKKSEIQVEGTSKDSEKLYNDLLASLSFQPKAKKEKLSDTELLASLLETERNAKRRRISYRNKIHTKNKSHTEVLREVIREQMEILKCNEDGSEDSKDYRNEKREDSEDMLEVSVTDGNPHLAWQTVGLVAADHHKEVKHDPNQRFDSHTSNSWQKTSDHRKYHHHTSRHNSSNRHKSPKYYYNSKDDRNKKSNHDSDKKSKSQSSSKYIERNSDRDKSPRHRRHKRKHSKSRRSVSQENDSRSRNKRKKRRSDYE